MRKLSFRVAIGVFVLAGAGLTVAQTPQAGAAKATLTTQDYIDIQMLLARYAFAIDTCANNGYDYADLFAPDGAFYYNTSPNARVARGRDQLAEAAGGGKAGCKKMTAATPEKPVQSHVTVNVIIEPAPGGAIGRNYLMYPGVLGVPGDPTHSGHVGGYQDKYVKTAAGWRFKARVHLFPPLVPGSFVFPEDR